MEENNSDYINIDGCNYRKNVGILLYNNNGKVFIAKRNQNKIEYKWQFPQGGIDIGESPETAVLRELKEETGITNAKIVYEDNIWRAYKFPAELKFSEKKSHDYYKNVHGQIQKWFLIEFTGNESEIKLPNDELLEYKWIDLNLDIVKDIVPFKREVYENLIKEMQPILKDIMKNKYLIKKKEV